MLKNASYCNAFNAFDAFERLNLSNAKGTRVDYTSVVCNAL